MMERRMDCLNVYLIKCALAIARVAGYMLKCHIF